MRGTKQQIEWRRNQVLELSSKGYTQSEIANTLQVNVSTISRDISFLRDQAKENIKKYVDERLPMEYEKCLVGITSIMKEAWNTSQKTDDNREKIQALSLAKDCYGMKLDLLTNASVIDKALEFVELKQEQKEKQEQKQNNVPPSSNPTSAPLDSNGPNTANNKHTHKKADENVHAKGNGRQVKKAKSIKSSNFSQGVNNDDIQGSKEEIIARGTATTNQTF